MQEEQLAESNQESQTVQWLEAQKKIDGEQIVRAQQDLERLSLRMNELVAQVQRISEEVKMDHSHLATIPFAEEGIRQLREQMSTIQQRLDMREQSLEREALMRQSEAERDRKVIGDLAQQLSELVRQDDQHVGRIQMLLEDTKRSRADLAASLERVGASEKFVTSISGRTQLIEEYIRRFDSRIATLEQVQENLKSDNGRFTQWQQAADLRWTRYTTQWQDQMDEWKRDAGDNMKSVQTLARQLDQVKNDIHELRTAIEENHKRIEDQAAEMLRMENVRIHDREDNARLEQAVEVQKRRVDDQSDTLKVLQEQILRNSQQFIDVEARFESERKRIDESNVSSRQIDVKQQQITTEMMELHRLLREQNQALAEQTQASQRNLEDLARKWELYYADLHQMVEQQKSREAAELDRQLMEIRDRINRLKG